MYSLPPPRQKNSAGAPLSDQIVWIGLVAEHIFMKLCVRRCMYIEGGTHLILISGQCTVNHRLPRDKIEANHQTEPPLKFH